MSERKVLNKYYPPDFDPTKIPRVKRDHNKTFTVRLMAPFNMKCTTCGEYIYKGRKFNARKEDVENEDFLGLRIYRFYIKCTRCLSEISFKTDPASTDYVIDAGATRNFMALKLAEEQAVKEDDARKEMEASNPMQMLENRTKQSREEIEAIEALEELREMNKRQQSLNYEGMLDSYEVVRQKELDRVIKKAEDEDEELVRRYFGTKEDGSKIKRVLDDDDSGERKFKVPKSESKKNASLLPLLKGSQTNKLTLTGLVKKINTAVVKTSLIQEVKSQLTEEKVCGSSSLIDGADLEAPVKIGAPSASATAIETQSDEDLVERKSKETIQDSVLLSVPSVSSSFEYIQKAAVVSKVAAVKVKGTGLSLLGAYSSDSDSSDD